MRLLQLPQLQKQRVIDRVFNLRPVKHVIGVLVAPKLVAQFLDSGADIGLRHSFFSGARVPLRIFNPLPSNFTTSSSSVRVRVDLTTTPGPKLGCSTLSPAL